MAYVRSQQQNEQQVQNENPLQQQAPVAPGAASGPQQPQNQTVQLSSAPVASGPQTTPSPQGTAGEPATQQRRRTGGVTNFGRILEANAPQAQGLASNIGGQFLNENVTNLRQQQEESLARLRSGVEGSRQDYGVITQGLQDPTAVLSDPEQFNQFQSVYRGEYMGPEGLSEEDLIEYNRMFETIADDTNVFEDEGQLRQQLEQLDERYSPGRTSFDLALLQADRDSADILRGYDEQLQNIAEQEREQFESIIGSTVEDARTEATEMGERARGEADTRLNTFQQGIVDRARQLQDQGITTQQAFDLALAQEQDLTDEQLADLGVTREQYESLRDDPDLRLQNYLRQLDSMNTIVDPQTAATMDEYDYYAALSELLARDQEFLTDRQLVDTADADYSEFLTDEALLGQRALDILRRTYTDDDAVQVDRDTVAAAGGHQAAAQNVMDQIMVERNLDPERTAYETVFAGEADRINELKEQGYVLGADLSRSGDNLHLYYKPAFQAAPTELYDPETGQMISVGDIAFPEYDRSAFYTDYRGNPLPPDELQQRIEQILGRQPTSGYVDPFRQRMGR